MTYLTSASFWGENSGENTISKFSFYTEENSGKNANLEFSFQLRRRCRGKCHIWLLLPTEEKIQGKMPFQSFASYSEEKSGENAIQCFILTLKKIQGKMPYLTFASYWGENSGENANSEFASKSNKGRPPQDLRWGPYAVVEREPRPHYTFFQVPLNLSKAH